MPQAFFKFNQSYVPPSPVASPLTTYDAHEMADSIRRTVILIDVAIAAELAAHVEATNISGQDFLNLSPTGLRKLSQNNEKVFQVLRKLQQTLPTTPPARSPSIKKSFSPFSHNLRLPGDSGSPSDDGANSTGIGNVMHYLNDSTTMLSSQNPEEGFSDEAFDYSDDEEEVTPDLYSAVTIVDETSPPQVSVLQDDLSLLDQSLQPDASVNSALEDGPPLATSLFSNLEDESPVMGENDSNPLGQADISNVLINHNSPPISAVTFLPNTHTTSTTTQARDGSILRHSEEDVHTTELQLIRDAPITPTTTFCAAEASIYGLGESEPVNPIDSRLADGLEGDSTLLQNDSVLTGPDLPAHCHSTPDTRSSSPALSYVDEEDPDALLEQDWLPTIATDSSPTTELPSQSISDSLEGSPLEISLTLSHDYPQTLIDSQDALEPPSEPAVTLSDSPGYPLPDLPSFPEFSLPGLEPYNPISDDTCFDVGEESNGQTSSPQPSPSSSASFLEPSPVLSPTRPHSINADIQSAAASTEDSVVEVSSSPSPLCSHNPARQEGHLDLNSDAVPPLDLQCLQDTDERSNVDTNIPGTSTHGSAYTFTLPPVPVTPSGSPILEDLFQYMTSHGLDVPAVINSRVDLGTPVQPEVERTLWPPSTSTSSESQPASNSLEPSNPSKSTSGTEDVDIAVQPDLLCPQHIPHHAQVRDSYIGMSSRRGSSPFQRIQLGLLNVIPAIFALDRETINRATSCSPTSPRL